MRDKELTSHLLNVVPDINLIKTDKSERFRIIHAFGSSENMTGQVLDISNAGNFAWPQNVFKTQIVSDNINDTALGNGARAVIVKGLEFIGSNLRDAVEEIPTNGLIPVIGTKDFFRINEAFVSQSGVYATTSNLSHQGDITISNNGTIHATIRIDEGVALGQAEIARFTTPSDAKGYLQGISANTESSKSAKYFAWQREKCNVVTAPFTAKRIMFTSPPFEGQNIFRSKNPFILEPNTDIWFSATSPMGANNEITLGFELTVEYFDFDFSQ